MPLKIIPEEEQLMLNRKKIFLVLAVIPSLAGAMTISVYSEVKAAESAKPAPDKSVAPKTDAAKPGATKPAAANAASEKKLPQNQPRPKMPPPKPLRRNRGRCWRISLFRKSAVLARC
jgi:hypothetical protein